MMNDKQWIRLMELGEMLGCHQMPERSFFIKGFQFPVCARCIGVILSAIIATILKESIIVRAVKKRTDLQNVKLL